MFEIHCSLNMYVKADSATPLRYAQNDGKFPNPACPLPTPDSPLPLSKPLEPTSHPLLPFYFTTELFRTVMSELESILQAMRTGIHRIADKVPDLPEQEVVLARMLMVAGDLITQRLTRVLRPHGLSESDFRTLVVLFSSEQGEAFPSELCQFATQKPTNMTRIADGLVARGLASRSHSDSDRRRILIRISPAGRRFVRKLLPELSPRVSELFSVLSERERRQLDAIVEKLLNHVGQHEADTEDKQ